MSRRTVDLRSSIMPKDAALAKEPSSFGIRNSSDRTEAMRGKRRMESGSNRERGETREQHGAGAQKDTVHETRNE